MEELRRIREGAGISQSELARRSGVDRATINKIEQGRRSPSIATLEALAETMGVEVADFFPKTQPQLPLHDQVVGAPASYTAYEALGRALALQWHEELDEWNKTFPPGDKELDDSDRFWGLTEWALGMMRTKSVYETVAYEAGYSRRPEFLDTLAGMEEARSGGIAKFRRILNRMKTDVDFHRIIKENDLLREFQLDA